MIKVLISDFWHVLLFPKDFKMRGSSSVVSKIVGMEYAVNEELLAFYSQVKKEHEVQLAVYSSGTLVKTPEFQPLLVPMFERIFSTADINYEKDNPESFRFLAKQFDVLPSEMIFVDDVENNLEAAREAGVITVHYRSNLQVIGEIEQIL